MGDSSNGAPLSARHERAEIDRLPLRTVIAACAFVAAGATSSADPALPVYGYVFTPPATAVQTPRILKIELNSDHLSPHGPIAIRVSTTPDVTSVVTGHGAISANSRGSHPASSRASRRCRGYT
jgi:hypothetical protein